MVLFARDDASLAVSDEEQAISYFMAAKLISDLKVIKIKCKSEMRTSLGKLLPLPDTVVDKVLKSILCGSSLEEYKFEEVPAENIGKINMMYGRLTSIFVILRNVTGEYQNWCTNELLDDRMDGGGESIPCKPCRRRR